MKKSFLFIILALLLAAVLLCGCDKGETPPVDDGATEAPAAPTCADGHNFGEVKTVKAAGCETTGSLRRVCTACGEEQITETPATGHSFEGSVTVTAPTCEQMGTEKQVCTGCAAERTVPIPATGHTYITQTVRAAGCDETGLQRTVCSGCGIYTENELPAKGHAESGWVTLTPATCLAAGERVKTCTVCGDILRRDTLAIKTHVEDSWKEVALAGGGVADYMTLSCKNCPTVLRTEKKENIVVTVGSKQSKILSNYRIVYPAGELSRAFAASLVRLAEAVSAKTGTVVKIVPDTELASSSEIIVGNANRPQVATALSSVNGFGYTVQLINGRIVIVGSTEQITQMGIEYFLTLCAQSRGSSVSMYKSAVSDRYNMITVADGNGIYYTPVYDADLDTDTSNEYGVVNLGTGRDYAYDAALAIRDRLLALTGRSTLSLKTDATAATVGEILIGRPDRAQVNALLATVEGDTFTVAVRDGRVLATAWSLEGQRQAIKHLEGLLGDAIYTDGSGKQSILLPVNFTYVHTANENWFTDFQKPALPLHSTVDVGDSSLQYIYMGDGVSLDAYQSYCASLLKNGYRVLTESSLQGSYFKTLVNTAGTATLQVAYHAHANKNTLPTGQEFAYSAPSVRVTAAYVNAKISDYPRVGSYAERYTGDADTTERIHYNTNGSFTFAYFNTTYRQKLIDMGYTILCEDLTGAVKFYTAKNANTGAYIYVEHIPTYETSSYTGPAMRILYRSQGVINLPTSAMLNPTQSYTKVTDSAITAVKLPGNSVGTGYVITLEDGRFIIIDGGSMTDKGNAQALLDILTDLYKKVWKREPSKQQPIVIAAWYITHSHSDHINVFWDFTKEGRGDYVRLEHLIANTPTSSMLYNTGEANETLRREMTKIHGYYGQSFTFIKVQTGQTLYFANVGLEVLYTPGDLAPHNTVAFNDSSVIIRLHFKPTDGDEVTLMSMGDCFKYAARWLCSMYGNALQSDMATLAHHGGPGTENTVYDLIAPKVLWWPHVKGSIYGCYLKNSDWHCRVDQHVFYNATSEYVFISDDYNITLFLRADGPDYANLYAAAGNGATIPCYELSKSPTTLEKLRLLSSKPVAVKKV